MTDSTTKAIETRYKGYRFRSRLEARWAVFFDALRLKWAYEVEGFNLPSGLYLPDFWFPEIKTWIEVKGVRPAWNSREFNLCRELSRHSGFPVFVVFGELEPLWFNSETCEVIGCSGVGFYPVKRPDTSSQDDDGCCEFGECPLCKTVSIAVHGQHDSCECRCDGLGYLDERGSARCNKCDMFNPHTAACFDDGRHRPWMNSRSHRILSAFSAARSARFEHGETPHAR